MYITRNTHITLTSTHTHKHTLTSTHTHKHTHKHTHSQAHTLTSTHTHKHTHSQAHTLTSTHTSTHTHKHTYSQAHTLTSTHTHKPTHSQAHTHTHMTHCALDDLGCPLWLQGYGASLPRGNGLAGKREGWSQLLTTGRVQFLTRGHGMGRRGTQASAPWGHPRAAFLATEVRPRAPLQCASYVVTLYMFTEETIGHYSWSPIHADPHAHEHTHMCTTTGDPHALEHTHTHMCTTTGDPHTLEHTHMCTTTGDPHALEHTHVYHYW